MKRYACKRDGEIHDSTICPTREGAVMLGKIYCCNHIKDSPVPEQGRRWKKSNAWSHLVETGRIEIVKIQIREVRA